MNQGDGGVQAEQLQSGGTQGGEGGEGAVQGWRGSLGRRMLPPAEGAVAGIQAVQRGPLISCRMKSRVLYKE